MKQPTRRPVEDLDDDGVVNAVPEQRHIHLSVGAKVELDGVTLHILSLPQQCRRRTTLRVQLDHAVERSAEQENDDRAEPKERAERDRRLTCRGSAPCDENETEDTCGKRSECRVQAELRFRALRRVAARA